MKLDLGSLLKNKLIVYAIGTVVVLVAGGGILGYVKYSRLESELASIKANPGSAGQLSSDEQRKLVAAVGKLIALPVDEMPTIAVVADPERLRQQGFFLTAAKDDKILVYPSLKKAILYRPSINRVIDIAPVNIGANPTPGSGSGNVAQPSLQQLSFVLRNGTQESGLTGKLETLLKAKFADIKITKKENATKRDYVATLVVDVKGNKSTLAEGFAKIIGAQIAPLPQGEVAPDADFLVIAGKDLVTSP